MARVAGVEPAAPSFGGSCSIQLSYTRSSRPFVLGLVPSVKRPVPSQGRCSRTLRLAQRLRLAYAPLGKRSPLGADVVLSRLCRRGRVGLEGWGTTAASH